MASFFPPSPAYPTAIDSDYTLFLVHNTAESVIAADNEPYADEIPIMPVPLGGTELWADNGFATISGELLYYDAVERDEHGRIVLLRRCARNLGGQPTRANKRGEWIRGFVIAEHHNQMVDAIVNVEDFVGINFDPRVETLDYRIRNLRETPPIFDDWTCVDINFSFIIIENNPSTGILASYDVQISGEFSEYRLDFGDGTFTSDQTGTHRYAFNSAVSPVVTVSNSKCTVIQSPIQRDNPDEPQQIVDPLPFTITIPTIQDVPPFVIPSQELPEPDIDLPPLIMPCLDLVSFPGISIGDISIGDINVPSVVEITPVDIPSIISIVPMIPSEITITPIEIPSIISIDVPSIPPISFLVPSIPPVNVDIDITIDAGDIPSCISLGCDEAEINVNWGLPPTLNVAFVSGLNAQSAKKPLYDPELAKELGEDYLALFEEDNSWDSLQVEYEAVGIPSEIKIAPPQFPDIKVVHDLPQEIKLTPVDVPREIALRLIEPLPKSISITHDIPSMIELVGLEIPKVVKVEHDLPEAIRLDVLGEIPSQITIDATGIPESIKLVGAPETIELKGPESIKLVLDDNIEVPLVYRQGPIELKVELDMQKIMGTDENGENPCVMIVPCR